MNRRNIEARAYATGQFLFTVGVMFAILGLGGQNMATFERMDPTLDLEVIRNKFQLATDLTYYSSIGAGLGGSLMFLARASAIDRMGKTKA